MVKVLAEEMGPQVLSSAAALGKLNIVRYLLPKIHKMDPEAVAGEAVAGEEVQRP